MQKNVGTMDAVIRITFGLLGLAYGAGRMSRRPYKTPGLLMFLSAMKVAEGVTRFCPMLKMMGISTRREDMLRMMLDKTIRSATKTSGEQNVKNRQSTQNNNQSMQTAQDSKNRMDVTDAMIKNAADEFTKAVSQSHAAGGVE